MPPLTCLAGPNAGLRLLRLCALLLVVIHTVSACASLPPPPPRSASQALADPQNTAWGRRIAAVTPQPGVSGFRIVTSGSDALATLLTMADQAERTLDLQYYIVTNEPSTRLLMQHVRAAADRGVRVRLLVDDMNTAGTDDALRRLTDHPRIEVRLYNPLPAGRFSTITKVMTSLTNMQRINRRMHNKMFVADNAIGFMGGRNLGDAYFLRSDKANFVDMDAVVAGPAVRALSRSFDRYWNSELAYPVTEIVRSAAKPAPSASELDVAPAEQVAPAPPLDPGAVAGELMPGGKLRLQWARSRLLADDPAKLQEPEQLTPDETMFDDVRSLLRSAQREVLVISPYLVPGKDGMALLRELRQRGVKVRILTCSLASTDAPVVHIGYARYRPQMLEAGIELYELRPQLGEDRSRFGAFGQSQARLHAKALVVDGRHLLIGSMNLDRRSMDLNSEIALLIRSPELAQDMRKLFDEVTSRDSYRVELAPHERLHWVWQAPGAPAPVVETKEPESSFWRRLTLQLLAPFAPEEML